MSLTALDPDTRRDRVARWSALGCLVHVEVADELVLDDACVLAVEVLRDVDETASRFRADSDLSAVNARPGAWVRVDPLLVAAVEVAVEAAERTGGLVHPLLGRPLVSLGYDRTFTRLEERSHLGLATAATAATAPARDAWREIAWREDAVRIPSGTALDLGATAKAWCADLIAAAWRERLGLDDALVSVGGDLRTLGERPWPVAITERPPTEPDPAPLMVGPPAPSRPPRPGCGAGGAAASSTTTCSTRAPACRP
ncbi:FAD:protein FMN transferase [Nocardioides sp. TRM66260-LWL]|uniref:FAD:protein FMN transferase n=1 Tax=Nocardioides sp. TRM66260-LWL TaxID=2874478 RepID=UPI0021E149BE|nr:FAD:protein FMN transferase [Nocardioides sp. TRM66260-LWL]